MKTLFLKEMESPFLFPRLGLDDVPTVSVRSHSEASLAQIVRSAFINMRIHIFFLFFSIVRSAQQASEKLGI